MKHIVILTGSARPNTAGKPLTELAQTMLEEQGVEVEVIDVAQLNLPFFNATMPPSAEGYEIPHDSVKAWSKKVQAADGVVLMMPEYNHAMSAVQKNALDWLYSEWRDKPLAIIAYGFSAGKNSLTNFEAINTNIKTDVVGTVGMQFLQQLEVDGSIKDEGVARQMIEPTLAALVEKVS
ncbi:MAG: NAD(P)H-dependent oxidoreductase [Pseudomonadales bacterium]|nr:NAD(P)H-dependent oxidoreductase [Candidatus Woesebacteria bacterium]MCB9801632.1 NAD(P)H-dependent oxidoreductase [Pseudomonadales bacterium]